MKSIFSLLSISSFLVLFAQEAPTIEWSKTFGGAGDDFGYDFISSNDGNLMVVGMSDSIDGDVSGNHGGQDFWVVKVSQSGDIIWQKSYGGTQDEYASKIIPGIDGGYVLVGRSESSDGDVSENQGLEDIWIVKIDEAGTILWEKSYGGSLTEYPSKIIQTQDDGYLVVGATNSDDGDVSDSNGGYDVWVMKLDASGNLVWKNNYGGSNAETGISAVQLPDNSYIIGNYTLSSDGNVPDNYGGNDYWVFKIDSFGNLVWSQNYGGSDSDEVYEMNLVPDGVLILGRTQSNDGDITENNGNFDAWIVKTDFEGNILWEKSIGGSSYDAVVNSYYDGAIYLIGITDSNNGDFSQNYGIADGWLAKIDDFGNIEWINNYGGSGYDLFSGITKTTENNLILFGDTNSNDVDIPNNQGGTDFWIVKLTPDQMSTSENDTSQISIYPNPVKDILHFSEELKNIEIHSVLGQIILKNQNGIILNVADLVAGTYFLKAQTQKGDKVQLKFMKK